MYIVQCTYLRCNVHDLDASAVPLSGFRAVLRENGEGCL